MALNIEDPVTEELAREVAELAGESTTEAVRVALRQRRDRLRLANAPGSRRETVLRCLSEEVWPLLPEDRTPLTKAEREAILGYGPEGV